MEDYPPIGTAVFCTPVASGHAWQGKDEDFGIFIFPFGVIFHQPAILECIPMVYLENSSWQDDKLSEFHQLFPLKALRIISDASYQALLFCLHVLRRSAPSIWPSPSRPKDFQTLTL